MKKNAIGHVMMRKESAASFLRRSYILPKLLCLLSALVIWLLIVNLTPADKTVENGLPAQQLEVTTEAPGN